MLSRGQVSKGDSFAIAANGVGSYFRHVSSCVSTSSMMPDHGRLFMLI